MPSPSESLLRGFRPFLTSVPSLIRSPSVSALRGLVRTLLTSRPSFRVSRSVSALRGSVPIFRSRLLESPSRSRSFEPATAEAGIRAISPSAVRTRVRNRMRLVDCISLSFPFSPVEIDRGLWRYLLDPARTQKLRANGEFR